ncbi:neurexin-3 [Alligator mississippiensis]|uniref:neurexin-3 n=1 Tax=Alligator mississippiensis TaxID=8496 RepID=UPI0028773D38|nr:neurexin-3 [Alligator mississippiensis]
MGFTLHSVCFTLKVSLLLGSLLGLCLGLEFMGLPNQWARYLRWDASTRSDLSFQFKTNVSAGLLLYFDDGGVCDFLCLSLVDGRIQLRFSVDCAETTVITDKQVNDSNWHFLMVSRNHLRTVLVLDGEAKPGEVRPQRQYMNIVSDLFMGGVPSDIRPAALTLDGVLSEPPFQGFILDLKYGNSEPQLLGSHGARLDMEGLCAENPCENGGTCFLLDGEPHCDCSATGYVGKLCSEDVNHIPGLSHLMMGEQAMAICQIETSFTNVQERGFCEAEESHGAYNGVNTTESWSLSSGQ